MADPSKRFTSASSSSSTAVVPVVKAAVVTDENIRQKGEALDLRFGRTEPTRVARTPITEELMKIFSEFSIDLDELIDQAVKDLAEFAYDGFDPQKFRILLLSHWHSVCGGDMALVRTLAQEAIFLIVQQGIKIRTEDKLMQKAKDAVAHLKARGVNMNPKNFSPPANVITLGRIAAVFPREIGAVLAQSNARIVGNRPVGLPKFLAHPHAPATFPRDRDTTALWVLYYEWRDDFSKIVDTLNRTDEERKRSDENFSGLAYNSNLLTDKERNEYFIKMIGKLDIEERKDAKWIRAMKY